MTKKHYIVLAKEINEIWQTVTAMNDAMNPPDVVKWVVRELMYVLKADNPNFDRHRFEEACYK